jgi:hypothetical protein
MRRKRSLVAVLAAGASPQFPIRPRVERYNADFRNTLSLRCTAVDVQSIRTGCTIAGGTGSSTGPGFRLNDSRSACARKGSPACDSPISQPHPRRGR